MALFPAEFIEELRARLPVSVVVGKRVQLKKAGREWKGLSPFNAEKTPSFFVNDMKQNWFDFSSGKNGDIIDFEMQTTGCDWRAAVEKLAGDAGMPIPKTNGNGAASVEKRQSLIDILELAAAFYEDQLAGSEKATAYLAARKISAFAAERFRIGYSPDDRFALKEHLGGKGVSVEDMTAVGLLIHGEDVPVPYDRFRNRIMFPITDLKHRVIGFGARALDSTTTPKYLNSPDSQLFHKGQLLYNAAAARTAVQKGSQLIVVEGYMDVIALATATFEGAVAPMGTALTVEQLDALWRIHQEPVLCFDGDSAGRRAAYRALELALPKVSGEHRLRFVLLPDGIDPDELIRERGRDAMVKAMREFVSFADMLWDRETSAAAMDTPEACAMVRKRVGEAVAKIEDQSTRELYQDEFKVRLDRLFAHERAKAAGEAVQDVSEGGLYRGMDIGEALAGERMIMVAASEADCDALTAIGLSATTAPGGVDGWQTRHSVELQGADVVVVAGAAPEAVRRLCTALAGHVSRLRALELPIDVPSWINDGGTAEAIYAKAEKIGKWSAEPFKSKFGAYAWGEPREARETYQYLIKGLIPRRETVLIYGASGSGKTYFTFDLAMAPVRAADDPSFNYRGLRVKPGLVVYCAAEAGMGFVDLRMPAYSARFGFPLDKGLKPFVCLTKKFDLFGSDAQLIELIAEIRHHISRYDIPLEVIVIDTLNKTTPGMDEIHGKDVGIVMDRLDRLRAAFNCGLWLVHHKNAAGTGPRGHTSLFAAFETAIEVSKSGRKTEGRLQRPIRIAKVIKQREGEDGKEFEFVLAQQMVGKDEDGDDRPSCVVEAIGGDVASANAKPVKDARFMLRDGSEETLFRCLVEAISERGVPVSQLGIKLPGSISVMVEFKEVALRYREKALVADEDPERGNDRIRKQIIAASSKLKKYNIIASQKNWVWWTGRLVRTSRGPIAGPGEIGRMDDGDLPPLPDDADAITE